MPGERTRLPCDCCDICTTPFSEVYSQFQRMFTLLWSDPLELRTGHCFTLSIQLLKGKCDRLVLSYQMRFLFASFLYIRLYSLPNFLLPRPSKHTSTTHLSSNAFIQKT